MTTLLRFTESPEMTVRDNTMNELMHRLVEGARYVGVDSLSGNAPSASKKSWVPTVDVCETESELLYAFDLPGIREDEISVELDGHILTVSGERVRPVINGRGLYRYERRFGPFQRAITLPKEASTDGVHASSHDGVLEIRIAKPAQPKPRRIQIGQPNETALET